MSQFTLCKSERLHRDKAISRLFTEGRSGFAHPFRYFWLVSADMERQDGTPQDGEPTVAVLFSVPKKQFKRAVKRNLLKRRTKEAYRLSRNGLMETARAKGKHIDLALVYSTKELSDLKTIEDGVKRILEKIGRSL
jgi:ribonuclease P protein component